MILQEGILETNDYESFIIRSESYAIISEFKGSSNAGKALPGDTVSWDVESQICKVITRKSHRSLVGVLELASKTKYGMTSRGVTRYLFLPIHKHYPPMIVGCSHKDITKNCLVVVDFDTWDTTNLPKGLLRHLIGPCGNPQAEQQAILFHYSNYSISRNISKPVLLTESRSDPRIVCPSCTFNIDPPGCKDIDDVLSFEEIDDTIIQIWITISDVAAFIPNGSDLDIAAGVQAFTVYQDGSAIQPMLPYHISESRCSLVPDQPRLGISLILRFDKSNLNTILEKSWKLTTVLNKRQYEYDTFIEKAKEDAIPLEILQKVASGLLGKETNDPHEWIEAFMLTYNLEAAQILQKAGKGILRKHIGPDLEKLAAYSALGSDELMVLANRAAVYCLTDDSDATHYGLQAKSYCHASSPIRRYADLVNQRIIRSYILDKKEYVIPNITWLNSRQKQIKQYERDSFFLKIVLDSTSSKTISAIVITKEPTVKLWISSWKRLVKWRSCTSSQSFEVGSSIELEYFVNPQSRFWKEKIVFRLKE